MNASIDQIISQAKSAYEDEDFAQAAELYKNAQKEYTAALDPLAAAEMANNCSVALLKAGDAKGALQVVEGTDIVFSQANDVKRQAMALANKAAALESLKRFPEALELYEQSNELLKQIGENELRAYVLKSISSVQLRQGKQLEAIASMQASLDNKPNPGVKDRFVKRLIQQVFKLLSR
jgi:tetratricopeptide (TPR) repeat protein